MPLNDLELWAVANRLVGGHGRRAHLNVAERLLELEAAGDVDGHIAWLMIGERVTKLLRDKPAPGEVLQ
jgi:hypothetical protein